MAPDSVIDAVKPGEVSPVVLCWWVVAAAAAAHVSASLLGGQAFAGPAIALALAALAAIVMLGAGPGRAALGGGILLLAADAAWLAQSGSDGGRQTVEPFYAPLTPSKPYSASEDVAWLGQALWAQLVENWLILLAVPLICVGVIVALRAEPPVEDRWPRRVAWVVVATVAILWLADIAAVGPLARQLVTAGAMLPTMIVAGAALAVLVVAASRPGQLAVRVGGFLLMLAVLAADLSRVGPARPAVLNDLYAFTSTSDSAITMRAGTAVATPGDASGLVTAPLLALLPLLAITLLVAGSRRRILTPPSGEPDVTSPADPGDT